MVQKVLVYNKGGRKKAGEMWGDELMMPLDPLKFSPKPPHFSLSANILLLKVGQGPHFQKCCKGIQKHLLDSFL